jgi:NTE family protein
MPAPEAAPHKVNLALQGGGAHGAFTWGVIDRLLEDGRLQIEGVCGTSAGAMNGVALAYGLARGGPAEARSTLARFWHAVAERARFSPFQPTLLDRAISVGDMNFSPGWLFYDVISRLISPYVANPANLNPLVEVLDDIIDFAWLREHYTVQLFVCATNVKRGKIRVFSGEEVSSKAVMASACLPFLYQAVEIGGEYYWDGGFMGNPPLYPLIYHTECEDILIVQINPIQVDEVPTTASAIVDRMNELSFNSSLMREMRAIAFVQKLVAQDRVDRGRYKHVKIHVVEAEAEMRQLGYSSKLNASRAFLDWLFALGRERAGVFLDEHLNKIGVTSSVDVAAKFL